MDHGIKQYYGPSSIDYGLKIKTNVMMQFEIEKPESSIIKVFGVGGGGSNAVNHMYKAGIKGVDFFICNTDEQSLEMSPVPNKIQLGLNLTGGRGAGSIAEVGKNAAIENIDEIRIKITVWGPLLVSSLTSIPFGGPLGMNRMAYWYDPMHLIT